MSPLGRPSLSFARPCARIGDRECVFCSVLSCVMGWVWWRQWHSHVFHVWTFCFEDAKCTARTLCGCNVGNTSHLQFVAQIRNPLTYCVHPMRTMQFVSWNSFRTVRWLFFDTFHFVALFSRCVRPNAVNICIIGDCLFLFVSCECCSCQCGTDHCSKNKNGLWLITHNVHSSSNLHRICGDYCRTMEMYSDRRLFHTIAHRSAGRWAAGIAANRWHRHLSKQCFQRHKWQLVARWSQRSTCHTMRSAG